MPYSASKKRQTSWAAVLSARWAAAVAQLKAGLAKTEAAGDNGVASWLWRATYRLQDRLKEGREEERRCGSRRTRIAVAGLTHRLFGWRAARSVNILAADISALRRRRMEGVRYDGNVTPAPRQAASRSKSLGVRLALVYLRRAAAYSHGALTRASRSGTQQSISFAWCWRLGG